ncbi:EAL domain-containing protein [Acidobacteria bacterium AB60]|nr:EAL domain-containing protein [Acidobacteria bacterium AB60]
MIGLAGILIAELTYQLDPCPQLETITGPAHELFGFAAEDFLSGQVSFLDRIHPHDCDVVAPLFASGQLASGQVVLRFRHGGGRILCLQVTYQKQHTDNRTTLHLQLQNAVALCCNPLSGDAAYFRVMIENTEEEVFFKDRNHVFIAASSRFRAAMARFLNGRELVGLTDYDILPEADADMFYATEKQVLAEGTSTDVLHEVVRAGESISVNAQYHPVRGDAGQMVGVFATVHGARTHLRAEEKVEGPGRSPRMGGYVLDLRRGVSTTSAMVDSIFGIDKRYPHDVQGWAALVHPSDRARMMDYFQSVVTSPDGIFNMEYRIVRQSDGEVRWVHGLGRVDRSADGVPLVLRGTIGDITERKEAEAALLKSKERLQAMIENAPVGLAMFDCDMRYLAASGRWLEIIGRPGENILGRCHYDLLPNSESYREIHQRALAGEPQKCDEDRFQRPDGSVQWRRWEILPWRADDGQLGGIVSFMEDISEKKEAERRLRLSASVFEHATEAILVFDLDMRIIEMNESFTRITGYAREEVLGRHPNILRSDLHDDAFYASMWKTVRETGRWRGELWNRSKSGAMSAVVCTITTVADSAGNAQYYVALFYDITPIKEQEKRLEHIAHFDALTGLPNRTLLGDRLRHAMASARDTNRMLAVIYIDLDNFKAINDRQGKDAADALLVSVAGRMKHVLRDADTLGRLSGDEFVAILPDLGSPEAATAALDRLLQAVGEPYIIGEQELRVSATAGASFYPQNQDVDADQLLRQADQAMYEAKLAGKGRYHIFDPVRDHTVRGRHEELARIRQALAAGEFVLYYQPKVNMATGQLVAAEALIRWQHPQRGLLPPADFLPVIEDDPLAIDVGEWVIDRALSQIATWMHGGHRLRVNINVSAKQLEQVDFIARLGQLLARHPEVSPSLLGLEVLESSALRDVAMVSEVIQACGQMGIRVAIDDFGTGYSSLTYLKRLPAPVLKIDQSFVRDMLDDVEDLAILQGILGLATAFRRMPVAEGVESVGHGLVLLRLGCEVGQGYGIARPMPPEQLFLWYAGWRPDPRWRNVVPLSPLDWPVLTAEVEQGAWVRALARYLKGEAANPPELEEARSRFGVWLESERRNPRAARGTIGLMEDLHRKSHQAARRAVTLKKRGRHAEAAALLESVLKASDAMQAHFEASLRGAPPALPPAVAVEHPDLARIPLPTAKVQ